MEKKVTKKFYLLSSINIVAAVILAYPQLNDALALIGALIVLVLNHTTLIKMVSELARSLSGSSDDAKRSLRKILLLLFIKMALLASVVVMIYFYNKDLTPKLLLLMIFQLIIQIVSIKNNY